MGGGGQLAAKVIMRSESPSLLKIWSIALTSRENNVAKGSRPIRENIVNKDIEFPAHVRKGLKISNNSSFDVSPVNLSLADWDFLSLMFFSEELFCLTKFFLELQKERCFRLGWGRGDGSHWVCFHCRGQIFAGKTKLTRHWRHGALPNLSDISGVKKLSVSAFCWFGVCKWGLAVTKAWTPRGSRGEHSERSLAAEPCPTEVSSVGHKHVTQAHNEGWRARNEKSPQGESSFCRCPSQSPLQFFLCESRLGLMPLANASPRRKW